MFPTLNKNKKKNLQFESPPSWTLPISAPVYFVPDIHLTGSCKIHVITLILEDFRVTFPPLTSACSTTLSL